MLYLTTYFDKNYLSRGIVLYQSLIDTGTAFQLFVLCLDDFTKNYFQENKNKFSCITTITLADLEQSDSELLACKSSRNLVEYYFTLSPCLPIFLIEKFSLPHICTLDADILFLHNPNKLFQYLNDFSIVITPHKFSNEIKELEKFGKYNVSFQIFKNDEIGMACLKRWRTQCIAWCSDFYDEQNNRFADQKYLDEWTTLYPNKVKELDDAVSGLAPWNLNHYNIQLKKEQFISNNEPIVFYHFHHFKLFTDKLATNGFYFYKAKTYKTIYKLYLSYWNKLEKINQQLATQKDVMQRTHLSGNNTIYQKLLDEGSAFVKLSNKNILYLDFQTWKGRLLKYILKLYA